MRCLNAAATTASLQTDIVMTSVSRNKMIANTQHRSRMHVWPLHSLSIILSRLDAHQMGSQTQHRVKSESHTIADLTHDQASACSIDARDASDHWPYSWCCNSLLRTLLHDSVCKCMIVYPSVFECIVHLHDVLLCDGSLDAFAST